MERLQQINNNSDNLTSMIQTDKNQKSENFNSDGKLKLDDIQAVKDGWYWGTTIDGVPNGFGSLLFKPGVNYNAPKVKDLVYYRLVNVFYEGEFKQGMMDGVGVLKTLGVDHQSQAITRVLQGMFNNNRFTGIGKSFIKGDSESEVCIGEFKDGVAHGKATKKTDEAINHGNYQEGTLSGANLSIRLKGDPYTYFGHQDNNKYQGLGYKRCTKNNNMYIGEFSDNWQKGLGKCYNNQEKTFYKGQWVTNQKHGYGEEYRNDGTCFYKGFYFTNTKKGIGIQIDNTGKETYCVYYRDKLVRELTNDEVKAVNQDGVHKEVKEMQEFVKDLTREKLNYTLDDKLDFDWISNQGHLISSQVDELEKLAEQNNLFNHELDQKIINELNEFETKRDELMKQLEDNEIIFRKQAFVQGINLTQLHLPIIFKKRWIEQRIEGPLYFIRRTKEDIEKNKARMQEQDFQNKDDQYQQQVKDLVEGYQVAIDARANQRTYYQDKLPDVIKELQDVYSQQIQGNIQFVTQFSDSLYRKVKKELKIMESEDRIAFDIIYIKFWETKMQNDPQKANEEIKFYAEEIEKYEKDIQTFKEELEQIIKEIELEVIEGPNIQMDWQSEIKIIQSEKNEFNYKCQKYIDNINNKMKENNI